jgi:peptide/nickel transport system permease protein
MSAHSASNPAQALALHEVDSRHAGKTRSLWRDAAAQFRRHYMAMAGLVVLIVIALAAVAGPFVSPYDPETIDFKVKNEGPSWSHPLGTDDLGRDQLTRILYGGRVSLGVALAAVAVASTVGVTIGAVAGYTGGIVDNLLMRLVDVCYAMPGLFVVILVMTLVGPSMTSIIVTIGLLRWMGTARLVRAGFLSLKQQEFVESARALGVPNWRIIVRHILPNTLSPIIVASTLGIAGAILTESALSFLGLGFQPPTATWGRMLSEAQSAVINKGYWWRGLFPGLVIFLVVLSVNYVGDGLRDAIDPRRRRR